jgi:hypothetical protein
MRQIVKQAAFGLIAALALLALVTVAENADQEVARATSLSVGVDTNATGNSSTAVGTVDACRVVSINQVFDIDLVFENGISNLIAADMWFQYDSTKLQIQSYTIMYLNDPPTSQIQDGSEDLPDVFEPGVFHIGAVDNGETQGDTGLEGVLFRINVKAIGTGLSSARISKMDVDNDGIPDRGITLVNSSDVNIGDTNGDSLYDGTTVNSAVFVGSGTSCTTDSDSDGIPNVMDNCPNTPNANQADWNFDGVGDACQDFDSDGLGDTVDNCPGVANPGQENQDGDQYGDLCDSDRDGDGVPNSTDNCLTTPNASQTDTDGDGMGNACDSDMDNDAWDNSVEGTIGTMEDDKCPADSGSNNENPDAWPPDFDDDQSVTILDVLALKPVFLSSIGDGTYQARKDIAPVTGPNGSIDIIDVLALKPWFLKNCETDL